MSQFKTRDLLIVDRDFMDAAAVRARGVETSKMIDKAVEFAHKKYANLGIARTVGLEISKTSRVRRRALRQGLKKMNAATRTSLL